MSTVWIIVLTTVWGGYASGQSVDIIDGFANRAACEAAAITIARQVNQQTGDNRIKVNCIEIDKGQPQEARR
jgi:hypothetical protein